MRSTLLLLLILVFQTVNAQQGNNKHFYNLDLEKLNLSGMPDGWKVPKDSTSVAFKLDSLTRHSGKYSLLIDWDDRLGEWTATNYVIGDAFGGESIKLTGYLKTENVTGWAGLWLRIDGEEKTLQFDNMQTRPVKGTTDWKEYTIDLPYEKEQVKKIVFGSLIIGTGKVWMDNLHLSIDGIDVSEAPLFDRADASKNNKHKNYNLDIEERNVSTHLPRGWGLGNVSTTTTPNDKSIAAFRIDSVTKRHGNYSLLIDWDDKYGEWTASNYIIKELYDGSTIKLTGFLKSEGITGWGGLWMRIDGEDKTLEFDNMQSRPVKGTTDWQEYTIELPYNKEEVNRIVVGSVISGPGKLWIDDLHISIDGKDISEAPLYVKKVVEYKADQDTEYNHGSGIQNIKTDKDKIKEFTNLGMLWGFLKYYHADVNAGNYNMDAALFKVLPKVFSAGSVKEANDIMEKWVDEFGIPEKCAKCEDFKKTDKTKLEPDYGDLFIKSNLPITLVEKLEYIRHNRYQGTKHYYIGMEGGVGNPIFKHERAYTANPYPDAGVRLLSLFRFWNIVQYFFPDRHLTGEDWNKVLPEFIPAFCDAQNVSEYQQACLKLIARVHDTHANIWGGGTEIEKMKGNLITPFNASFIGKDLVVTKYYKPSADLENKIKIGDVISKIDGVPVTNLVKKYLPMLPASNYETQLRDITGTRGFLLRSNNTQAKLTVQRNAGAEVSVDRVKLTQEIYMLDYQKDKKSYRTLDGNIGYVYPGTLQERDIDSIRILFKDTKGIIIDMRCYPSTFMPFTYGAWLKPTPSKFVKFTTGSIDLPGSFTFGEEEENGDSDQNAYKGKVIIIVNEETQSQAEYTTMALCTAPHATVIGSTTAGADGNVSEIILPGGIKTMFSGIGILYPDGTETQRKGVKIDKVVKPTIEGIREGRDELLEEAIRIIKE